jgi:replicative DNA helicase
MEQITIDIEKKTLAYLLQNGSRAVITASRILDENDFSNTQHRLIFSCIGGATGDGSFSDAGSFIQWIGKNRNWLNIHFKRLSFKDDVNDARSKLIDRIIELSSVEIEPSFNLNKSCEIIYEHSFRNRLIEPLAKAINDLKDGGDPFDALDNLYQFSIENFLKLSELKPTASLHEAGNELIAEMERENAGEIVRYSTGLESLDAIIGGLERSRLYTLAAPEKQGKSIFAASTAFHNAKRKVPTVIISLEMRKREIAKRFFIQQCGMDAVKRRDVEALRLINSEWQKLPLYIFENTISVKNIRREIERFLYEKDVRLFIVDYLQLIQTDGTGYSRTDELNSCVRTLKQTAQDLDIAILLISSLTIKQIAQRSYKKPTSADFYYSGQVSYDSDCVLMMWRPIEDDPEYTELFVERSRYSKTGEPIPLKFDMERLLFRLTEKRELSQIPVNGNESYF